METSVATTSSFAVETMGLTKRYPLTWKRKVLVALDRLDLKIHPGEVFGLLGPNGSGKSTTLKLLLGLITPSAGEARIFGLPPHSLEARKRVGFLPENPYFYGFLNGDETLRFYGKLCGVSGPKLDKRVEELIDLVGLQNGRERPLRAYSKGMLQRIGLAQALIHDPDLLFLDEPTAGVDPLGSSQIRDLILKLKKMGKTVIFSSHLLEQVQEVADRVAIFALGKKILEGSIDSLLTMDESTEIQIPGQLTAEDQKRLRELLRQAGINEQAIQFSHPRRSLEQLYLRTVQAQSTSPAKSTPPFMISSLLRILVIGRITLTEAVRQKVLTVLLIFGVFLVASSVGISQLATPGLDAAGLFTEQIKFVKDMGCGAIGLIGAFIAILSTAMMVPQELQNRTIYTILAKPVRRAEFLLGKFLGSVLLVALCVALMSLAFAGALYWQEVQDVEQTGIIYNIQDPSWGKNTAALEMYNHDIHQIETQVRDPQLIEALLLIFAKLIMTAAITLLISTFATSWIFTVITTAMIYLIGHMESIARVVWLARGPDTNMWQSGLVGLISLLIPDMNSFTIVDEILAGNRVPWAHTFNLLGYADLYVLVLLGASVVIFEFREL